MKHLNSNQTALRSLVIAGLFVAMNVTTGCGGDSNNAVPEVTKDELADYQRQLDEVQAKANDEEDE